MIDLMNILYRGLMPIVEYRRLILAYRSQDALIKGYLKNTPQPELTREEKREIDAYWEQYGIRFKNYDWFQWFYGFTGIHSPKFIPGDIHRNIIMQFYAKRFSNEFSRALADKNMFYDILPDVRFPDPILKVIDGDFFDKSDRYLRGGDDVIDLLVSTGGDVIAKRSIATCQGKSIKKYSIMDEQDARKLLDDHKDEPNFIVQKAVRQHPFFARFNESSVNVIRINSLYVNGEVDIHTPILRFGYPGWVTDVSFIDGQEDVRVIAITEDGCLADEVISMQGKRWRLGDVVQDPENRTIPAWDKIVAIVKENAPRVRHNGRVGWDITVSEDGEPVVIEYNLGYPGSYLSQIAAGPLFGDRTDAALEFLKDEKNQKKYIPPWMRCK